MNERQTIVEIRGGIADVTHGGHNTLVIDWDDEMDFDRAHNLVSLILDSSLDGPTIFFYIREITEKFEEFCKDREVTK